ncbi:hypothetical protein [Tranquillimonas rosea]|uniref:hypothetical protein n=1 Tax=Tranquillimonas rosea TaxID=641238 RepID=UPI003BA879FC
MTIYAFLAVNAPTSLLRISTNSDDPIDYSIIVFFSITLIIVIFFLLWIGVRLLFHAISSFLGLDKNNTRFGPILAGYTSMAISTAIFIGIASLFPDLSTALQNALEMSKE